MLNGRCRLFAPVCRATLVVSLAAQPASVAQAPQNPKFSSRADLVQVDVVVVDKDGNPVRGLKATDFTVLDRGRRQSVATFDEVTHERARDAAPVAAARIRRDVATNQSSRATRLVVLVIDDLHIYKDRTGRAKDIARRVVGEFGAEASMAVLFTSGDHGTQVTEDRALLLDAVETLKGRQGWRRPHQAIDEQKAAIVIEDSAARAAAVSTANEARLQDFFDNMGQYNTLRDAARMLGANDARRKAFVMVSEGIGKELSGLFGAMAPPGDAPEGGAEYAVSSNAAATIVPGPEQFHANAVIAAMDSMRRSNVATYAIDPRGLVRSQDLARECYPAPSPGTDPCWQGLTDWGSPVRQAQRGLALMSDASGGFAVTNTDDFTAGLDRIVGDLDHYYLLGFYPSDPKGRGYRLLRVAIEGHPDWTLRYRRGYMAGDPPAGPKNADPLVALSAGVLPKTDLPLRLTAIPFAGPNKLSRLLIALEVTAPVRELREPTGLLRDTLKYEVLVVDERKNKVKSMGGLEGRLTMSPSGRGGVIPASVDYQVRQTFELTPGKYQLRVAATSAKLGKGGSVYLDVDVPDFGAPVNAISAIALGYADGAHVPVAPPPRAPGMPAPRSAESFPITLNRTFTAADVLSVHIALTRDGAWSPTLDLLDAQMHPVRTLAVPAAQRGAVDARLPLDGLPAGAYVLRASAPGVTARELAFSIVGPDS